MSIIGKKRIKQSIFVNICLAAVKLVAGIFGNSYALIEDAIESGSDAITSVIVLLGLHIASKEADENHPYGHGKAEPIASVIVTLFLLGSAIWIAVSAFEQIRTPHETPAPYTLIVLAITVLVKVWWAKKVMTTGDNIGSNALKADAWHHLSDAFTSAAAFIGISIALFGGKGYETADDWAALLSSFIIGAGAISVFRPALSEIMDGAVADEIIEDLRQIALEVQGVLATEKCFVRKMGLSFYVDFHVCVDGNLTVSEGHAIAHRVKDRILQELPQIKDVLIHIEPFEN
jgi:cation diffusion facilitator family transporter